MTQRSIITGTLALFSIFCSSAQVLSQTINPIELIQHLQQQQLLRQQMEAQRQQQLLQQQQKAQQSTPLPQQQAQPEDTQLKETFKSFNGKSPLMIKGSFTTTTPENNNQIPNFRIYFRGKETISDKEGFFSINIDEGRIDQYTLVFTKYPQPYHDKHNTLKGLKILPNASYKCITYRGIGRQWIPRETYIDKRTLEIPKDAIVVLVDPKYIDHLDAWNLTLGYNFVQLPRIVLKANIKNKPLNRASAKSLLSSLDLLPFHEEVVQEIKQPLKKVELTLAQ